MKCKICKDEGYLVTNENDLLGRPCRVPCDSCSKETNCESCGQDLNNADPTSHICPEKDYEPPDEMLVAKDEKYA